MKRIFVFLIVFLPLLMFPASAMADIAPPAQPRGANPVPGGEGTQVRMVAEMVVIEVKRDVPQDSLGQADVTATFTMVNQGETEERMDVRFPLTFWNGLSDGFGSYPEIDDLRVEVEGQPRGTRRVTTPNPYNPDIPIPWAAFEVVFPPEREIVIEVQYTAEAMGEYPNIAFGYVLETGAGWNGTIGSADLVVRLPYEANRQNVVFETHTGYSMTTSGGEIQGSEVLWHYEDLEPTSEQNLEVSLVMPEAWETVLRERMNVAQDPEGGEAWGRLGKIYKEMARLRRGLRQDAGGQELFELSKEAYEKAVALLPEDALWHAGYAELLWDHYFWDVFMPGSTDYGELVRAAELARRAYELDQDVLFILDLLDDMRYAMPEAVVKEGDTYIFLVLTATPTTPPTERPTDTPAPTTADVTDAPPATPTETDIPEVSSTPTPSVRPTGTTEATVTEATPEGGISFPLCGALLLAPLAVLARRRRRTS